VPPFTVHQRYAIQSSLVLNVGPLPKNAHAQRTKHRTLSLYSFSGVYFAPPPFDGLSIENSACHSDSHPPCLPPFAGDFAGDDCCGSRSKWRCSERMDFDGDFERWRALLSVSL